MAKKEAVFHLFYRRNPFQGGFAVASGLEYIIDYIKHFKFSEDDISYLASLRDSEGELHFSNEFLQELKDLEFSCDIDAVPEGTVVFPYEPLIRVSGPIIQCQLLESPLLTLFNFPTLIATKASRVCLAAENDTVLEFGLRRAQGIDGALTASRSAYIGGVHATSNVLAGKLFDIPVKGTHSHAWVMAFDDEEESFRSFAEAQPGNSIFLVDTFNTVEGVKKAIRVGKWLESIGKQMIGIRLDSGDLAYLSRVSRKMLDDAGMPYAKIFASNELDEIIITELKRQGAKIDIWGVGTNLVTGKDHPALDGVYKLSAIRDPEGPWHYTLKLSEQMRKVSNPGVLQVRRFFNEDGAVADAIYDIHNHPKEDSQWTLVDPFDSTRRKHMSNEWESKDLLEPIFKKGRLVYQTPPIGQIRQSTIDHLAQFHSGVKRFLNPHSYPVGMEKQLYEKKIELISRIRS